MDAIAWLALMSKANQVFGSPDVFLSFPAVIPISYQPENLNVSAALSNPQVGHTLADLSLNVNSLPTGVLFGGTSDTYLWQVYSRWLNDMVLAKDQMTDDERAQYDQAIALLTVKDSNGFLVDSPMVVSYKQYRDAWFSANQNYLNEKSTAEASNDPAVQDQWKNVDEPRLRALVDQATADWGNNGYKNEVENAQALKARLEARSPSSTWTAWRGALIDDIDLPTDPVSNMQYAPTIFSPTDVCSGDWPTFQLSSDEIKGLVSTAPDALRKVFFQGDGTSTITSLSFQFRSAALVRPWMNTDVFKARFWKFRDATPPLSDGAAPPQGSWPAYISAVVFARNITVTTQSGTPPQPVRALAVSATFLNAAMLPRVLKSPATEVAAPGPAIIRDHRPGVMQSFAAKTGFGAMMARRPMSFATPLVAGTPQASPLTRLVSASYRMPSGIFQATQSAGSSTQSAPPPPPPPPAQTTTADNDVSVLAFICRALPQTPNPDPSFNW